MTAPPGTIDWSTSYAEFFARSTERSVDTLKLYRQAMEFIAQGKLPATIFQDYLPRFAQLYGTEYSTKLAEIGGGFLTSLLTEGTVFAHDGQQNEMDGDSIRNGTAPPHFDPSNPARWFEQVAEYGEQLNGHALRTYRAQLDRVAAGESTPAEEQRIASLRIARDLPGYLQRISQLYFHLLERLTQVRADYEEDYFRGVLAAAKPARFHPDVILQLTAPLGAIASGSLSVSNTTSETTIVGYLVTEVRRIDGQGPAFNPSISITPENLLLKPGEEKTIAVVLRLDPQEFDPGAVYTGALYISGSPELRVAVELRITATSAFPAGAASASKDS